MSPYPSMPRPVPVVPPPAGGPVRLARVEPVPGTPFAVAYLSVPRPMSGPAIGSLVAGIGSVLVTVLVACFGSLASQGGAGALVGGAFAVLSTLLGGGAIGLGILGRRQPRRSAARGRGMAMAGLICGAAGIALTGLTMALLLAL